MVDVSVCVNVNGNEMMKRRQVQSRGLIGWE